MALDEIGPVGQGLLEHLLGDVSLPHPQADEGLVAERARLAGDDLQDGLRVVPHGHQFLPGQVAAGQRQAGLDVARRALDGRFEPGDLGVAFGRAPLLARQAAGEAAALAPLVGRAAHEEDQQAERRHGAGAPQEPAQRAGVARRGPDRDPGGGRVAPRHGDIRGHDRGAVEVPQRASGLELESVALASQLLRAPLRGSVVELAELAQERVGRRLEVARDETLARGPRRASRAIDAPGQGAAHDQPDRQGDERGDPVDLAAHRPGLPVARRLCPAPPAWPAVGLLAHAEHVARQLGVVREGVRGGGWLGRHALRLRPRSWRAQDAGHDRGAREQRGQGTRPHDPVDAAQRRLEADELAVGLLEVREDLLLVVAGGDHVPHLLAHVDRHADRRVGDGEPLAHGAAQQARDALRLRVERGAGERGAAGRPDEGARVRGRGGGLLAAQGGGPRPQREGENDGQAPPHGARSRALRRLADSAAASSGPMNLSATTPSAPMKNVSGTP